MATKTWVGTTSGAYNVSTNWVEGAVPTTADDVRIPAGTPAITSGLDQSLVAIGDFIVEAGYANTIGTSSADLQIDPDRFEFSGTGTSYIDIGSAAIAVTIKDAATAGTGLRGLYLIGSAITTANILKGKVGLASVHGTTASATTVRVSGSGADVWLGEGLTNTTVELYAGKVEQRGSSTNTKVYGGTLTTTEEGTIGTLTMEAGTAYLNSIGTITTLTGNGGTVDMTTSAASRTVTTLNPQPGFTIIYDPAIVTITNYNEPGKPCRVQHITP